MKKILVTACVSLFLATGLAYAQEAVKIGYVDMRKAVSECKAGKAAKEELDKAIKEKQAKVIEEKTKLEALQAEYEKKAPKLSDKEKQEKQKEFQEKVQVYQKMVSDAQKEVNAKEAEYTNKIVGDINKIIADISKAGKYTLVLGKTEGTILYGKEGLDLTGKVIQKMDARK
jgi:outer membrane protein